MTYQQYIAKLPLLTKEEEKDLVARMKNGDKEAREKLITHNLRLVLTAIRPYIGKGFDYDDLVQYGNVGLIYAADHFDPTRNAAFSTFATLCIKRELSLAVTNELHQIRRPRWVYEMNSKILKVETEYFSKHGELPSNDYIARVLEVPEVRIETARYGTTVFTTSIDEPLTDDGDTLLDIFAAEEKDPLDNPERLSAALAVGLKQLDSEELEVVERFYGLNGKQPQNLRDIGERLGMSHQQVANIKNMALMKLRHPDILQNIRRKL